MGGRQLHFNPRYGSATLRVSFDKGDAELRVSTLQMRILTLFNQKDVWTFKEIQEATRIQPEDLLTRSILRMAHPKIHILLKEPNNNTIGDDHTFKFNDGYTGGDRSLIKAPQRRSEAADEQPPSDESTSLDKAELRDCTIM